MKLIIPDGNPSRAVLIDNHGNDIIDQLRRDNCDVSVLNLRLEVDLCVLTLEISYPDFDSTGIKPEQLAFNIEGAEYKLVRSE